MSGTLTNWAGNITFGASAIHRPQSVDEVRRIVRRAGKVRALGSRHSFNTIADTDADLVSLARLNRVIELDEAARTVRVEGGITYGQLNVALEEAGYALHNLASLPHISVAGAIMTATHGSGDRNGNLATAVAGLEVVTADGDLIAISRGDPGFEGAVVSLGGLGVVTAVTLDVMPSFAVRQDLFLDLPFAAVAASFDAITASAYSVSLFTRWQGDDIDQVWLKSLGGGRFAFADNFFGARPADRAYHPIASIPADPCTEQMGVLGAWHERLPHFRMAFTPSAGEELQSEYFVGRTDAVAALQAVRRLQDRIAPLLLISEIRTVAADQLWMSMCHGRDSVGIHFTWKHDWPAVSRLLPDIEAALAPFRARPHWGKLFTMPAANVQAGYPRLADFRQLLERHDPKGKFRNDFVETFVF